MPGRPVSRSDDHGAAAHSLPAALMPVRLRTTEAGLVDFDGDLVRREIPGDGERRLGAVLVGLAQAVAEKPRAFLGHAEIAAQVKRGVSDQVAAEQMHADGPLLEGKMQRLHDGSRLHREPPVAVSVRAAVGGRSVRLRCRPARRSAVGADGAVGPDRLLDPEAGGPLGWKHLGQFDQADALALEPSRSLAPVRRTMWHVLVFLTDVHELNAFSMPFVQICQQTLKMPETLVRVGFQRSVC